MKPWRLFWVLALAAAGPLEGQATGQIAGIVKSSDGQPTASATVMVRGTKLSAVTGPDGRYTLPEVPPGSYTVVAALIGYGFATATASVVPGQVTQLDFALEPGAGPGGVQTEFRAGMSYAGQNPYGLPTLMNNDQYLAMLQAAAAYAGVPSDPQSVLTEPGRYAAYQAGQHTDWQKLISQTGIQKNVTMGMSGLSGATRFNMSGNFFDQTGTAVGFEFNRATGTAAVDHTQGRLHLGISGTLTHSKQTVNGGDALWGAARQQTGFGLPRDSTGALITNPDGDALAYNPLKLVLGRVSENRRDRVFASAFAQFDLFSGVNLRVNFGPDYTQASTGDFTGADVQFGGASFRTASFNQNTNFQYILDNMLQVSRDIGTEHHVDATLLYGIQKSRFTFGNASAWHIPYDEASYYGIGQGDNYQASSGLSETALESFMGRAVYTFRDKYTVMAAVRRDGSSVLAPGHKWTTFPTVGVAWQLGDQRFMQRFGWLSSLKMRGSYGKTGNAAISAYQTQGALSNGKINFGSFTAPAYYPNQI